jgi:cyclopropane fatty-acyl-phospholipid synthase-like methyltransferase
VKSRLLALPAAFDLYQQLVGAQQSKRLFVTRHVRASAGERVLDLGCGTGELLSYLPGGVSYVGVDLDSSYVARAEEKFRTQGEFVCADVTTYEPPVASFDAAIGYGILHHLGDEECSAALRVAEQALRPAGRALFAEPCRVPEQGLVERIVMNGDRGRHIRTVDEYMRIMRDRFAKAGADVIRGTYRIPFTLVVLHAHV